MAKICNQRSSELKQFQVNSQASSAISSRRLASTMHCKQIVSNFFQFQATFDQMQVSRNPYQAHVMNLKATFRQSKAKQFQASFKHIRFI